MKASIPPQRRARKRRRPEPPTFARDSETGERVRVWEYDACGNPLPFGEVLGGEQPPCATPEPEEDDTLYRYDAFGEDD